MNKRVKLRGAQPRQQKKPPMQLKQQLLRAAPVALAGVLVCVLMAGLIYLPNMLDGYPIQSVQVEGVKDVRRQHEVQAVLEELVNNENFFSVPLQKIYQGAIQLAWVESAYVRRDWPDRVIVSVEERLPVAVWNKTELVSSAGKPFSAVNKYSIDNLPRLFGPERRLQEVMSYYHSISNVLVNSGLKIKTLDVDARLTARLELNNGIMMTVDREKYAKKIRRFLNLYDSVLSKDDRKVERVDLRYGDAVAVEWQRGTETQAKERV